MTQSEEKRLKKVAANILSRMEVCKNPTTLKELTASYRNIQETLARYSSTMGGEDDPVRELLRRWDEAAGMC